MNKEEKSKTLFSSGGVFVDIFIGFLIAACIAGIVYRCFIYDPHVSESTGESYMVYFEIENAQPEFADYLEVDDALYDSASGIRLGQLVEIPSESPEGSVVLCTQDSDGNTMIKGVFLSRKGELVQGSLVLDGTYKLTPGQVLEVYTDTVSVNVRIMRIDEKTAAVVPQEQPTETAGTQPDSE